MAATDEVVVVQQIKWSEIEHDVDTLYDLGVLANWEIKKREFLGPTATIHTRVRYYFGSDTANYIFFIVNMCYLVFCIIRGQRNFKKDEDDTDFYYIEIGFTFYFTIHLFVHMFSLWPNAIYDNYIWNAMNISLCLGSSVVVYTRIFGYNCILSLRSFKIFQPWLHLPKLRSIYISFMGTLEQAMVITASLYLFMSFFTTGGVEWFHEVSILKDGIPSGEYYFSNYGSGMYTMMQCVMGDAWASEVARSIMEQWPVSGSIFFVVYILFVGIIVMNLFAAIFLESFLNGRVMATESYKRGILQSIFDCVDEDGSGYLDKTEVVILKNKMSSIPGEDFDADELFITASKNDDDGEITFPELYTAYVCINDEELKKHKSKYAQMEQIVDLLNVYLNNIVIKQKEEKERIEKLHKEFDAIMTKLQVFLEKQAESNSSVFEGHL